MTVDSAHSLHYAILRYISVLNNDNNNLSIKFIRPLYPWNSKHKHMNTVIRFLQFWISVYFSVVKHMYILFRTLLISYYVGSSLPACIETMNSTVLTPDVR